MLFWWLKTRVPAKIIERTAENIQETQDENAKSRKSHIKATRSKLRACRHQTDRSRALHLEYKLAL